MNWLLKNWKVYIKIDDSIIQSIASLRDRISVISCIWYNALPTDKFKNQNMMECKIIFMFNLIRVLAVFKQLIYFKLKSK